ncbi:MAG: hypothetical protein EBU33_04440, partial [Sphingobacteriia bacterium]|nr:hypothetical protein [Sphingobacteriia bacterium]
ARGAPYAQEVVAKEACGAATRPGTLVGYSAGSGGLPGLTGFAGGGTRRAKKSKKFSFKNLAKSFKNFLKSKPMKKRVKSKTQRGGRWTADTAAAYASGPNVFLPVSRIGCEGGLVNTSPPGAHNPAMAFKQMGGAGTLASPYYSAQNAGYTKEQATKATIGGGVINIGGTAATDEQLAGLNRNINKTQEITKDTILFSGHGYGHGLGMPQEGAMRMVKLGYNYKQVLKFYYQEVQLIDLHKLNFFKDE